MPRLTTEEIQNVIDNLTSALDYAKEARRIAKKVYGDDKEISLHLKYAYEYVQHATRTLQMQAD